MISDRLYAMAERFSVYALSGRGIEPEVAGCIACELMDAARAATVLETLPFVVMSEEPERRR